MEPRDDGTGDRDAGRPGDLDPDTGWFFTPQSDEEAGLSYRGEAPHRETPSPAGRTSLSPAETVGVPGPAVRGAGPAQATSQPTPDDPGQSTAPFVPTWDARTAPAATPPAANPPPGQGAVPTAPAHSAARMASPVPPPPAVPVPARQPPGRDGNGAWRAITLGVMVGVIVLFLAWYFLVRGTAEDPSRAVPVRTTPAATTPAATAKPTPTRTSRSARPTTSRPTATPTPTPTPTPSPTSSLNDPANRLGWTFLIDGLGPVKLGLNAEEAVGLGVLQAVPTPCDAFSATALLGETKVYSTGGTVTAIDIRSPAFASGRGIRVGSPLSDLQKAYGDSLKRTVMTDAGEPIEQWALTAGDQYIAYLVDGSGPVQRIAIGYRSADGSITLPPPC